MIRRPPSLLSFLGNPPITFLRGVVDNGAFTIPQSEIRVPLPDNVAAAEGTKLMLGVRPEHFTPKQATSPCPARSPSPKRKVARTSTTWLLPSGPLLRSIQPVRSDVHVGDDVRWAIDSRGIFVFDENGRRL